MAQEIPTLWAACKPMQAQALTGLVMTGASEARVSARRAEGMTARWCWSCSLSSVVWEASEAWAGVGWPWLRRRGAEGGREVGSRL